MDVIHQHENNKSQKKTVSDKSTQQASTSGTSKPRNYPVTRSEDVDSDSSESDTDLCCVCNLFTPKEVSSSSLIFVKWVQCGACEH